MVMSLWPRFLAHPVYAKSAVHLFDAIHNRWADRHLLVVDFLLTAFRLAVRIICQFSCRSARSEQCDLVPDYRQYWAAMRDGYYVRSWQDSGVWL